jgi:glycosyltransferase involved in cell wall biosynthesis
VSGSPEVSVVIPTQNRPVALARCIDALDGQTIADAIEILVVDDGSRDRAAVAEAVGRSRRARLIGSERRGPAAARNRGADEAAGRTLLFVDDDCEPAPEWAHNLTKALATGAAAAAGRTVNARPEDRLAEASQTIANYLHDWTMTTEDQAAFAASNNLACTAPAFGQIRFDEEFAVAGGEDRDWCARLAQAGLTLVAVPSAVVTHHQDLTLQRFLRQQLNYGRGAYLFRARHGSTLRLAPTAFYRGLLSTAVERGPAVGGLVGLAQVATASGYALGALSGWHSRERR